MEGVLEMSAKERERLRAIEAIKERRLTQQTAAVRLGLSVRQVKRLCRVSRSRRGRVGVAQTRPIEQSAHCAQRAAANHQAGAPALQRFRPDLGRRIFA